LSEAKAKTDRRRTTPPILLPLRKGGGRCRLKNLTELAELTAIRVIPGGRYLIRTIADWEQHRDSIGTIIAALLDRADTDRTRPVIEFYRSQAELRILAPIK
jgi:DNA gyrase inhibitor GyrI